MQADQSLDDGQPQPGAFVAAREAVLSLQERFADSLDGLGAHADARVADRYRQHLALPAHGQRNLAAIMAEFYSIGE